MKSFLFILIISFILIPIVAEGAILYLEPAEAQYYQEDTFIVEIRFNTEGEYINTAKVNLEFNAEIIEVKDFSEGNSVLTLWVKNPTYSNQEGTVSLIGGVPGGYQGWDGLLGRIVFRAKQEGKVQINFPDSCQVLLNDGFGTPAELRREGATLTVLAEKREIPQDEWQEELEKDTTPPEPFEIEIHQTPEIFEGKYFIIFSTTDKQTGIDYFEVKEGEKDWQREESPYLLEDQDLQSIIKVKAIDKAGNERIAEYLPPKKPFPCWLIVTVAIGSVIVGWIIYKIIRKKLG